MNDCFRGCGSLIKAPVIPEGVLRSHDKTTVHPVRRTFFKVLCNDLLDSFGAEQVYYRVHGLFSVYTEPLLLKFFFYLPKIRTKRFKRAALESEGLL